MDIKAYIASGILENYVLGAVSDQERREVECLSKIYPELADELKSAQSAMEGFVQSLAVAPPPEMKARILAKIAETPQDLGEQTAQPQSAKVTPSDEKVSATIRPLFPVRSIAAAAVMALITLGSLFFVERNKAENLQAQLSEQEKLNDSKREELKGQLAGLQENVNTLAERERIMASTSTRELFMAGTAGQPDAKAKIFWDAKSNELLVASDGLPAPETGKQYQLWAIADGVPVDLGVLDKSATLSNPIQINLQGIQAFAITLEKEGGVKSPTLEQMYVIVSV